jgi:hypothetical protein
MATNLERYKKDLDRLIMNGEGLLVSLAYETSDRKETRRQLIQMLGAEKAKEREKLLGELPKVSEGYQPWYSEALVLLKQLLPDRIEDFIRHYEPPRRKREEITAATYRINDYLQGLTATRGGDLIVGPSAAVAHLRQQVEMVKAIKARFESSLFEIRKLVQADMFDSELDAARELAKSKFLRAAGALAGVVLEHQLGQVCSDHNVSMKKKDPGIADYNDALKAANVYDVAQWRYIQHLGDIRNLCDHKKPAEPTDAQVEDLISGVEKVTKVVH